MNTEEQKIEVKRSNGRVQQLNADELEDLNYQRKVRDQSSTGHLVTSRQINMFAVVVCVIVIFAYAVPRLIWHDNSEQSSYIPLSERIDQPSPRNVPATISTQNYDQSSTAIAVDSADEELELKVQAMQLEQSFAITNIIQQWAADWSAQDVSGYLSHYSRKFNSDTGMNIEQWSDYRASRILKPTWVQVLLVDIEVDVISDAIATVRFRQNYSASNFQEVSIKELGLETDTGIWKIISEIALD